MKPDLPVVCAHTVKNHKAKNHQKQHGSKQKPVWLPRFPLQAITSYAN